MAAEIICFDRALGTARVRVDEFVVSFAMIGNKLSITSKANEASSCMGPEGIWVPDSLMALARRAAYAVLTDGKKQPGKLASVAQFLLF